MQASGGASPKRLLAIACVAAALPLRAGLAADGLQGTAGVTTDYVHRGISQSDGRSAFQGSLTYWHPTGMYAGLWASTLRTANPYVYPASAGRDGADVELDLFAGYGRPLGTDWTIDLKTVAYLYPNDPAPVSYDYLEFSIGAAWRQRWYATLAVAPRTTWVARAGGGRDWTALDLELAWQRPVTAWLNLMLGAGYRELESPGRSGYLYGSTSLAMQMRHVSVELGWYTTDSTGQWLFGDRVAGSRTALTATVSF